MMSDILPGQIAGQGDSPKWAGGNKNTPLHTNDALTQFIKCHLLNEQFCVRSKERNVAAARAATEAESSGPVLLNRLLLLLNMAPPLETAWKGFQDTCKSAKTETLLYRPLCRFLTHLTGNRYLFIPWDNETVGDDRESLRQDIIVVNAQREDIDKFLKGDLVLSSLPDEFLYRDDKGKGRSRVYYSDIQMVGEVKVTNAPTSAQILYNHAVQVLKYLFTVSRYQPHHAHHIGFLSYLDGFVIIEYYPDRAFFSHLFAWDDPASRLALKKAITDIQDRLFTTNEFEVIKAMDRHDHSHIQFHLPGTSNTNDVHRLFDLHRGDGWHRNAYVGIGISKHVDERLDWNVIKHYWHDTRRRFNELQILQHIYNRPLEKKRCTAGIVRVDFHNS
ncbi:hypothetical protein APHAL10511_002502 [Amanita phalloides]|nr:hypothetical protein APHAL10511_002502 [Amanita phalloides]